MGRSRKKVTKKLKTSPASSSDVLKNIPSNKKPVLHVTYGSKKITSRLHKNFQGNEWHEVKLDIDPTTKPDIVADITNMKEVGSNIFDAIWAPHNLVTLFDHQVNEALKEFYRVLKVDGMLFLSVPDLTKVAEYIYKKDPEAKLFDSPKGPVSAIDILYGFRPVIKEGYAGGMCKTGFSAVTLSKRLTEFGFLDITTQRDSFNIWSVAYKRKEKTDENSKVKVLGNDVNDMMRVRDEIDQDPAEWSGFGKEKGNLVYNDEDRRR